MHRNITFIITIIIFVLYGTTCHAASVSIPEHYVSGDKAILYVYGEETDNLQVDYQIGNIACTVNSVSPIEKTDARIHTVILWDNSLSVMRNNDEAVRYLLQEIIANRANNEVFTLATLSNGIDFQNSETNDYVALKTTIDQMQVENKDAFVVENLYSIINAINQIEDYDFYRVIVVSDGVDSSVQGASLDELLKQLRETPYPIYTISTGGTSIDTTKNLFSISRATNSGYFSLNEELDITAILLTLREETKVIRIEAGIPIDIQDGSEKNTQLTIGNQVYEGLLKMPFSIKEDKSKVIENKPQVKVISEPVVETNNNEVRNIPYLTYVFVGTVIIGVIISIVILIMTNKKKRVAQAKKEFADKIDDFYGEVESDSEYTMLVGECETELISDSDCGFTVIDGGNESSIILQNAIDPTERYISKLAGTVAVGRGVKNHICIRDNKAVSEKHCEFFVVDGEVYIRDVGSSNGTKVHGERITSPSLIMSGDKVTIGFNDYIVTVK